MTARDLEGVPPAPGPEVAREEEVDDALGRSAEERYDTPRRYEEDERAADGPAEPR